MKKWVKRLIVVVGVLSLIVIGLTLHRSNEVKVFTHNIEKSKIAKKVIQYEDSSVSNDWSDIVSMQKKAINRGIDQNTYAVLEIPAIELILPIYQGANKYTLALGTATYYYDSKAGDGNFVLAGHSTPYQNVLFTNLVDVKKGDEIRVKTSEETFDYAVDKIQIVKDSIEITNGKLSENSFLALPKMNEKPKITLFTCFDWQDNTQRLVVSGHLK